MSRTTTIWTFVITSVALFMATLDNLVVTTSLPVIRADLGASIEDLEWTVNAYTLSFAVFLLTGAALGDRFGRRRLFVIGLGIFTAASVAAALAPSVEALIVARAVQGLGGAIVTPLTLTILSAAVSPEKRGVALGAWGGIGGLAVASGPLVGGAVVEGISWQWIFWLNVPIGLVLIPLAYFRLKETYGPATRLDLPGLALASTGLLGIVWGLVRGNAVGWSSPEIVGSLAIGAVLTAGVRPLGAPGTGADAADALLPQPGVLGGERGLALHVLRDVRLDLPAGAVPADRAGLQPAGRRAPHPPVDGDADLHRADRRRALRPHRRPAAHGHRARAPGDRARLAGGGLDADGPVRGARPGVRDLRDRDGALLRPGGQRRPLGGAPARGGPGLRRQQRHPRAGRRVRRRRPRLGLLELRRLRVGPGVRGRARPGGLGRRRRGRARRRRGALHPAQAPRRPRRPPRRRRRSPSWWPRRPRRLSRRRRRFRPSPPAAPRERSWLPS